MKDLDGWLRDIKEAFGPHKHQKLTELLPRLYEEIARLAGVADPKARVEQVIAEFNPQKIRPDTTEELIRRLEAP